MSKPVREKKSELEEAADKLSNMTPEDFVDLMKYVGELERKLPEAPASVTFAAFDPNNYDVRWTLRDVQEDVLLERYLQLVNVLTEVGWTADKVHPAAPMPTAFTAAQAPTTAASPAAPV